MYSIRFLEEAVQKGQTPRIQFNVLTLRKTRKVDTGILIVQ